MKRTGLVLSLSLLSLLAVAATNSAQAQNFPSKPVTVIIPQPAGGPTDVLLRAMGASAAKHLGQPVVIENRPGATGTLGPATMAASAKPDGYTVAITLSSVHRLPLQQNVPYNAETDFTYIMNLGNYAFVTVAGAGTPFKTMKDIIAYAKENPGKVSYATTGVGGSLHLAMENLAGREGIKLTHVPFAGATEIQAAVAGGHTMIGIDTPAVKQLADAGKVRVLSAWTDKRVALFPDVPTVTELGYPIVISSNFGLAGPKGMAPEVVKVLHDAFLKALNDPEIVAMIEKFGMVSDYKDTATYRAWISDQIKAEKALLAKLGIEKK